MKTKRIFLYIVNFILILLIGLACSGNTPVIEEKPTPDPEIPAPDPEPKYSDVPSHNPFVNGTEGYACYRIPTMVISKKGTILAFAEGRRNNCEDVGDIDIVMKRSTDGGQKWSELITVRDDGRNRCQNQCPVVLESGRILLVTCWNKNPSEGRFVFVTYSDDDGLTWAEHKDITPTVKLTGWDWYATGPCHGIVKKLEPNKGRIIIPANHNNNMGEYAHIIYSDDNGATWKLGGIMPNNQGNESTVVELSTGEIMLNSRNRAPKSDSHYRWVSISKDGGQSFKDVYPDLGLRDPGNGCQGSIIMHSYNNETKKYNILFSNPNSKDWRRNGTVRLSNDDASTWLYGYNYADPDPTKNFTSYSDLAVFENGTIAILYERGYQNAEGIWFKKIQLSDINQPL